MTAGEGPDAAGAARARRELQALPNIGPRLAEALVEAGIDSVAALREAGAVAAWWRIHPRFDCLHSLYDLEAALQGIPKRELDPATRARLRCEHDAG